MQLSRHDVDTIVDGSCDVAGKEKTDTSTHQASYAKDPDKNKTTSSEKSAEALLAEEQPNLALDQLEEALEERVLPDRRKTVTRRPPGQERRSGIPRRKSECTD